MFCPSNQKAHSIVVKEAAKNKQAQIRINRDFFLSFSFEMPKKNKKQAIIPETIENEIARLESIFNNSDC
jgi:hypothetical protein